MFATVYDCVDRFNIEIQIVDGDGCDSMRDLINLEWSPSWWVVFFVIKLFLLNGAILPI